MVGGTGTSGAAVASLDDLTDVTLSGETSGDILKHNGSAFVNVAASDAGHYEILMAAGTADPLLNADEDDYLYAWVS